MSLDGQVRMTVLLLAAVLFFGVGWARAPEPEPAASSEPPRVIEEGFLEGAGGVPLFYRIVGRSGPTVVAVHGGPGAGMNAF